MKLKMEEKYPLLLYFVDGSSNERNSKTNGRFYFEKGRWHNINSGATAILTQWPNQITGCHIATILASFLLIFGFICLLSTSSTHHRTLRCIPENGENLFNETTIHLIHHGNWTYKQLKMLETVLTTFPNFTINLISIDTENNRKLNGSAFVKIESATEKNRTKRENKRFLFKREINLDKRLEELKFNVQMGAKRLLDILLNTRKNITADPIPKITITSTEKNLAKIMENHPRIMKTNTSFHKLFHGSNLENSWKHLKENMLVFAARTLQIWQFAGITFDLNYSGGNFSHILIGTSKQNRTKREDNLNFLEHTKLEFETLASGMVKVDEGGYHILSKTKCHAFIEEILINLRKTKTKDMSPKYVIKKSLKPFCFHMQADSNYCKNVLH